MQFWFKLSNILVTDQQKYTESGTACAVNIYKNKENSTKEQMICQNKKTDSLQWDC